MQITVDELNALLEDAYNRGKQDAPPYYIYRYPSYQPDWPPFPIVTYSDNTS